MLIKKCVHICIYIKYIKTIYFYIDNKSDNKLWNITHMGAYHRKFSSQKPTKP